MNNKENTLDYLNDAQNQFTDDTLFSRSKSLLGKLKSLFIFKIIISVLLLCSLVVLCIHQYVFLDFPKSNMEAKGFVTIYDIFAFVFALVECLILFKMGKSHVEFKIAGLLNLFTYAHKIATSFLFFHLWGPLDLLLLAGMFYFFSEGMNNSLEMIDLSFTKKWENFKIWEIVLSLILYIICYSLDLFVALMKYPAIFLIVMNIWQAVLIKKSIPFLKNYLSDNFSDELKKSE